MTALTEIASDYLAAQAELARIELQEPELPDDPDEMIRVPVEERRAWSAWWRQAEPIFAQARVAARELAEALGVETTHPMNLTPLAEAEMTREETR